MDASQVHLEGNPLSVKSGWKRGTDGGEQEGSKMMPGQNFKGNPNDSDIREKTLRNQLIVALYLEGKFAYFSSFGTGRGCSDTTTTRTTQTGFKVSLLWGINTGLQLPELGPLSHALHKELQLLARCTHFLCSGKDGGRSWDNEQAPHRLLGFQDIEWEAVREGCRERLPGIHSG